MAKGGYRPGAGRPRKGEDAVRDELKNIPKVYETPLEYMLDVMNDPEVDPGRRDRMAIAAAPFVHAKAGESGKKETKQEAAKKAEAGRFAPAEPPRLVVNH